MINTIDIKIWGRSFSLEVEYNCYEGEQVTRDQVDALERFLKHLKWVDKAKKHVERFCKKDVEGDDENLKKDNIFSYIKPECIFVKHTENPGVSIMCKYRYDPEHGLAVVFDKHGKITVGIQDIII